MAFLWLINGGDPNHLQVTGMILQVPLDSNGILSPIISEDGIETINPTNFREGSGFLGL